MPPQPPPTGAGWRNDEANDAASATGTAGSGSPHLPDLHPADHWTAALERDFTHEDAASARSIDSGESSDALPPEWRDKLRMINGRWYAQAAGGSDQQGQDDQAGASSSYWGPVDENHLEHLDLVHQSLTLQLDERLFLAPLEPHRVRRAVDIATGSGAWALDFAEQFPDAEVIGTDLVPPDLDPKPDNVRVVVSDFLLDWKFPPNSVDFVHMRHLMGSVPDWPAVYRRAFTACAPGGWVEAVETDEDLHSDDGSVRPGSALYEWGVMWRRGARNMGRVWAPVRGNRLQRALIDAGFVDLHVRDVKTPIGPWPRDARGRELGVLAAMSLTVDMQNLIRFIVGQANEAWTEDDVAAYCRQFDREIRSRRFQPYLFTRVVWARKPGQPPEQLPELDV